MEKHDMGLGELGNPELVFARKFRFILKGEHLLRDFVTAVEVDYLNKLISFKAYECVLDGKINIHEWADAMSKKDYPEETLTLLVLDGAGTELYSNTFSVLQLVERKNAFDYSDNDVSQTEVVVSYKYREYKSDSATDWAKTYEFKESPNKDRTQEINHLNTKMWINKE